MKGKSLHYQNILQRVTNRLWDKLTPREREVIAADVAKETQLAKWFTSAVMSEALAKYESKDYWMNDKFTFKYAQHLPNETVVDFVQDQEQFEEAA